jgi:hypothetical protein
MYLLRIRLRHPPLPGEAFVDEGFAVGGEHLDLGLYAALEASELCELFVEKAAMARCSWSGGHGIGNWPTLVELVLARLVVRLPVASK